MLDLSIPQIQAKIDSGELTYEQLTAYYLKRTKRLNAGVNAISELNPNALEQARAMDYEYRTKGRRSMLHGIPIMVKDNINVASDGFHTTAGAFVFKDVQAPYDATIITKVREAGGLILGKTNLSEFANFISELSPNGFSALKGQVKNPYGHTDVGGSSSGSGVAVTMGFCQAAIGTETSGSIISPSHCNSIIGLKPTVGVASRYGIIPISSTQDIPGPMARHIDDIRILEEVIEGFDAHDPCTRESFRMGLRSWQDVDQVRLGSLRLGIYINQEYANDRLEANRHFMKVIDRLHEVGVSTQDVDFKKDNYTIDWDVLYYDFPVDMAAYLSTMGDAVPVESLLQIVVFNDADLKKHVPYDQKQFEVAVNKQEKYAIDYERALTDSYRYGGLMSRWMTAYDLDGVCFVNCDGTDIAARCGHPSITIPVGYDEKGAPVGFTITGPMFSEPKLTAMAEALIPIIGERKQL